MEHIFSIESTTVANAADRDYMIELEAEQAQMIEAGARWYYVVYNVQFSAGNIERITDSVLAFTRDEAAEIICADISGVEIIKVIAHDDVEND